MIGDEKLEKRIEDTRNEQILGEMSKNMGIIRHPPTSRYLHYYMVTLF